MDAGAARPPTPPLRSTVPASRTPAPRTGYGPARSRRTLLFAAVAIGLVLLGGLAALVLSMSGGDGGTKAAAAPTGPTTTSGSTKSVGGPLLAVLAPTQVAKTCTAQQAGSPDLLEVDRCKASANAPSSDPDEVDLFFYRTAPALAAAYASARKTIKLAPCGRSEGDSVWIHTTTGKTGGHRVCGIDPQGRFTIVWTHEKLGSEDHVNTLAIAREPGRSPTITTWWRSLNGFIGKCRPQIPLHTCVATIAAVSDKQ